MEPVSSDFQRQMDWAEESASDTQRLKWALENLTIAVERYTEKQDDLKQVIVKGFDDVVRAIEDSSRQGPRTERHRGEINPDLLGQGDKR